MEIPTVLSERVDSLSAELQVQLTVEKWWPNDFGTGYYCRALGLVHDSGAVRLEIVCCIAAGTGKDDVDLFVLLNGQRVAPVGSWDYLHQQGSGEFRLVHDDMAYDVQVDLNSLLLRKKRE